MKAIRRVMQEPLDRTEAAATPAQALAPQVRTLGAVNWIGLRTLLLKEISRFLKIFGQTILSPLVMTLLFAAMFAMGMPGPHKIGGVPFLQFVVPGLIVMSMAQSAFLNASSSLIIAKLQGNIVDMLMPPLSPIELTTGYAIAGVVRGLLVGVVSFGALFLFTPIPIAHPWAIAAFGILGTLMLSLIGLITGIWGDKFDHLGAVQSFLIMPATFLSGTFFSVESLPQQWQFVCFANPFFYMIDGFRYGFTGLSDGPILGGLGILLIVNLVLFDIAYWMFATGNRLKN